jgi:hypothetical protein
MGVVLMVALILSIPEAILAAKLEVRRGYPSLDQERDDA